MELLHSYIDSLAPNASAIKNGKALANGKFQKLFISEDETVIFGECSGSGKNPYICSVDFLDKENPIGRCNCPSRQIPCKHALGLMYAYANGKAFITENIPEDIISKRSKIEKRVENKEKKLKEAKEKAKEKAKDPVLKEAPKKSQITAAIKKINIQLEGIEIADKLLKNILQMGLASIDSATIKALEDQIKQLGNYYINGIQTGFYEILLNINVTKAENYDSSIASLLYMSSLLKKARTYLTEKANNKETALTLDTESEIEEQIGRAWKLEELMEYKKYKENARLVQLSFYSYDDESRQEYVDEGYYISLENGDIYKTKNYRPYKAVKYIKEDDSIFGIVETKELYIYPGGLNKRVRWSGYALKEYEQDTFSKIQKFANDNYQETAKIIKNQIKNPLSDKNPLALLKITDVITTKFEDKIYLEIVDKAGTRQMLADEGYLTLKTTYFMKHLSKDLLCNSSVLVMYQNNIESGLLVAKPLSIITNQEIVRLLY